MNMSDTFAKHMIEAAKGLHTNHETNLRLLEKVVGFELFIHMAFTETMDCVYKNPQGILYETLLSKVSTYVAYHIKGSEFVKNAKSPNTFRSDLYKMHTGLDHFATQDTTIDWMLGNPRIDSLLNDNTSQIEISSKAYRVVAQLEDTIQTLIHRCLIYFINTEDYLVIPERDNDKQKRYVYATTEEHREFKFYTHPQVLKGNDVHNSAPESVLLSTIKPLENLTYNMDKDFNELIHAVVTSEVYVEEFTVNGKLTHKYISNLRNLERGMEDWAEVNHEPFHLGYKFDSRGRIYPLANISPVGDKISRACLRAGKKVALGEFGYDRLLEAWAAYTTQPKATFAQRKAHTLENMVDVLAAGRTLSEGSSPEAIVLMTKMMMDDELESPVRAAGVAIELHRLAGCTEGISEFKSDVFITYDGSSNACQHIGLALKSPELAEAVNCYVDSKTEDKLYDFYSTLTKEMIKASRRASDKPFMKWYRKLPCLRKISKRMIMPRLYGAKAKTTRANVREVLVENKILEQMPQRTIRRYFTDGNGIEGLYTDFAKAIATLFAEVYKTSPTYSPLLTVETFLGDVARAYSSQGQQMQWPAPKLKGFANQTLQTRYVKSPSRQMRIKIDSKPVSVTTYGMAAQVFANDATPSVDTSKVIQKNKINSATPPNWVHSQDGYMMQRCIWLMDDQVEDLSFNMCHDSMGTTAGQATTLLTVLHGLWTEMYGGEKNIFEELSLDCQANTGVLIDPPATVLKDITEGIMKSKYSFA